METGNVDRSDDAKKSKYYAVLRRKKVSTSPFDKSVFAYMLRFCGLPQNIVDDIEFINVEIDDDNYNK